MARTYSLIVPYNQCLGARADPFSFTSLRLEDLRNGQSQYLSTMQQLVDALHKTEDPSLRYSLRGHIARPGQKRLRHSMRAVIWWLLPSDGIFRRASNSLRYYLTCQGRRVVLRGGDVTRPPLENHLNWVPDPVPPPARCPGDLAAPSPSENTPPQDASSKLPRRLRPRRLRERQPGLSTNSNSASRVAGPATQLGSPANRNSARPSSSTATRPRSAANKNSPLPGQRPGTSRSNISAPVEHPRTFLCPQHPQHPRLSANQNSGRRFDPDHPEIQGVYKPAQPSIQQDYHSTIRRDSFSGSGLSSPALQRSHRNSFSESPSRQLNKERSLTDSKREVRIARGQRSGMAYPLPRAARPDTRLEIDAALPEAAALHRAEWPPTIVDIPEAGRLEETRCPESSHRRGSRSPRRHTRKRPRNSSSGVCRLKKHSSHRGHWCELLASPWYKQGIADDLV